MTHFEFDWSQKGNVADSPQSQSADFASSGIRTRGLPFSSDECAPSHQGMSFDRPHRQTARFRSFPAAAQLGRPLWEPSQNGWLSVALH